MALKTELILQAVFAVLETVSAGTANHVRNVETPESLPDDGLIIQQDGTGGISDQTLGSDPVYFWDRRITIEAYSGKKTDASLGDLIELISIAINADPTFGGLVDVIGDVDIDQSATDDEGMPRIPGALITLPIEYVTSNRLG